MAQIKALKVLQASIQTGMTPVISAQQRHGLCVMGQPKLVDTRSFDRLSKLVKKPRGSCH